MKRFWRWAKFACVVVANIVATLHVWQQMDVGDAGLVTVGLLGFVVATLRVCAEEELEQLEAA